MAGKSEALLTEVDRIVNSPYPTQLKDLRDLVCTKCTGEDISRWVHLRPCQIARLTRCVLDGLRHWPFVLDIVARLSCEQTLRDAFLESEPSLLRDVIAQAVQAEALSSRYTQCAVAMLSHRLPEKIALPADCQTLLVQLFDRAAQQPSVSNIRPIYQLIQGASVSLLGVLSDNVLLRFENHLFNIVRNLKGDDQSLSLYCLAIMKSLARISDDSLSSFSPSSYDTQELLASTQCTTASKWKPDTMQQYFTERKAQKTMQLVVLRVMWACTSTTKDSFDEKMESLKLANEIIAAVPPHERETWRKANALVPKKFEEKVFSQALDPGLRLQALCFLVRLTEGSTVSVAVINGLRRMLLDANEAAMVLGGGQSDQLESLVHAGVFDGNTTTALVQNIVDFITGAELEKIAQRSSSLIMLLRQLTAGMKSQESIVEGTMLALDVLSCGHKLRSLTSSVTHSSVDHDEPADSGLCKHASRGSRVRITHQLCRLFLEASISSSHSAYSIPQESMSLLLDLHASSSRSTLDCQHTRVQPPAARTIPFVEAQCTPADSGTNWRDALQAEISAQSASHREQLERLFSRACGDLEERCNNVETPLQEERQRREALQVKYDQLDQAYAALETEGIDRNVRFDALEKERDQYLAELEAVQEENAKTESQMLELRQDLREANRRADVCVRDGQQRLETAELAHAVALASKAEELEDLQSGVQRLEEQLQDAKNELEQVRERLLSATATAETAQREIGQFDQWRTELQDALRVLAAEKETATSANEYLQGQIVNFQSALTEARDSHATEIRRIDEKADKRILAAKDETEERLSQISKEHEENLKLLNVKLSEAETRAVEAHQRYEDKLKRRDGEIDENHKELERLRHRYEQKRKQLAETNVMQCNIKAALAQLELAQRPSRSSNVDHSQEEDPSPPTPFSGDDFETQQQQQGTSFESQVSSNESRNGPTPKRPRPRKSYKTSPPIQPRLNVGTASRNTRASTRGQSTVKRQPLQDVGINQSPRKVKHCKTPSKTVGLDVGLDDSTFDGSELLRDLNGQG